MLSKEAGLEKLCKVMMDIEGGVEEGVTYRRGIQNFYALMSLRSPSVFPALSNSFFLSKTISSAEVWFNIGNEKVMLIKKI